MNCIQHLKYYIYAMLYIDQMGNEVVLPIQPQRIISLVPSQTELLYDLGLKDRIVGITKFCVHPGDWCNTVQKIGGTKEFDLEMIDSLQPDLIIGNKEENYEEGIEQLKKKYPVWMSDIGNLSDAKWMISEIGKITNTSEAADTLLSAIDVAFNKWKGHLPKGTVAYFIWNKPMMVCADNTFIHEMLKAGGWQNVFSDMNRYPEVTKAMIDERNPDFIFLSTEPYPFKEKNVRDYEALFPKSKVILVDGEMFSWYGSRLAKAPKYMATLTI